MGKRYETAQSGGDSQRAIFGRAAIRGCRHNGGGKRMGQYREAEPDKNRTKTELKEMKALVEPLLDWYDRSHRILPWRETPTAYRVWVSEIMLQQTRVAAVMPYYERFLKALPDIAHLAQVSEEELLKLWEGLGYYNRARNLQRAAVRIEEEYGGEMPDTWEELVKLPGIGSYRRRHCFHRIWTAGSGSGRKCTAYSGQSTYGRWGHYGAEGPQRDGKASALCHARRAGRRF